MNEQVAIQNILRKKFAEIQRMNPRFSLRAYSSRVGMHVGALTYIMNGKRNVSRKLAERIVRRLMLDPQDRSDILKLFPEKQKRNTALKETRAETAQYIQLTAAQYKILTEWEHYAILSLIKCEDYARDHSSSSIEWIAKRLAISETRVKTAVDRLIELKLIALDPGGKLARTQENYRTSDDVAEISLQRHHDQNLDLARESLHRDPVALRDFTSITMPVDLNKISAAKELIRKFQDELSDLVESGHTAEVYRLSVQLFPLTSISSK